MRFREQTDLLRIIVDSVSTSLVFNFINLPLTRTTKVEHKAPGMCGQEYVWTEQHTDKVKCPKMKLRVYTTLQTSFVSSPMLISFRLSLFDNFYNILTDQPTDQKGNNRSFSPELKNLGFL